jgi:hypothetical protein
MLDKQIIDKAIKKAESEQRSHFRILEAQGKEIGEISKQIRVQKKLIIAAKDKLTVLQLNKEMKAEQLQEMKIREAEIKGNRGAFLEMHKTTIVA